MQQLIPFSLPDTIDRELFEDFVSSRRENKKPMTPIAIKRLVRKLERLQAEGHCPNKLLEKSIIPGWQDVYPDESTKKTHSFIEKHTDRSWAEGL